MGSFNVGCGLSGLSISPGDRVGFVMLSPKRKHGRKKDETRALRWHLYANDLYDPYLPPVYGVYDDYGRLAELQASETTAAMESIFNRDALTAVNAVGQDRDVYSVYGEIAENYMEKELGEALGVPRKTDEEVLLTAGFTAAEAEEGFELAFEYRGHKVQSEVKGIEKNRPEGYRLWSLKDEEGKVLFSNVFTLNGATELLTEFSQATRLYPGFPEADWPAVSEIKNLSGMFFLADVYEPVLENVKQDTWNTQSVERWIERFKQAMEDVKAKELYSSDLSDIKRDIGMERMRSWRAVGEHISPESYRELNNLTTAMTSVNRMFMPGFSGEQHGNTPASLALVKASLKLVEERMRDEDEDDY